MRQRLLKLWQFLRNHRVGVMLVAILLLAAFFRFYKLNELPPGLHPDEAANGLDIFRMFDGDFRVLYNTNGPREALFFYIQALFVLIFGNTILALRLAPALIGLFAVWITYIWVKEWFTKRTALLAALFFAAGSWAVIITRDGFRATMVPLIIALNGWLVTKMVKSRKWYWGALAGLSFGAGLYTYFSYRLIAIALVGAFIMGLTKYRETLKKLVWPIVALITTTIIVLIPLGIYGLDHPDEVVTGRSSVTFTNPVLNDGKPLETLLETVGKTALMFNIKGDPNFRHNLGGAPMLNAIVGILFILGMLLSLKRIKDIRYFTLLLIFGSMLIPEVVTAEGIPHALRAIGVLPVVYIFGAIGLSELIVRFNGVFPRNQVAQAFLVSVVSLTLLSSVAYNWRLYFVAWANAPETYEAYNEDAVQLAYYLNTNQFDGTRYVVAGGYTDKTITYLTKDKAEYRRIDPAEIPGVDAGANFQLLIIESSFTEAAEKLDQLDIKFNVDEVESEARANITLFRVYTHQK